MFLLVGRQDSGCQISSAERSLDIAMLLTLNQLACVFPARLKLFRTNGPVVLTERHVMTASQKKRSTFII